MPETYDAVFEDQRGRETASIQNDGHDLRLSVRGVDFVGKSFDELCPVGAHIVQARSLFILQGEELCSCRIQWEMPLELEHNGQRVTGTLSAVLVLGDPKPNGSLTSQTLALDLKTPHETIHGSGTSGWFEDELLEISRALAVPTRIRSCLTCAFSDYSPYGHGLFGGLACFRDAKDQYLNVNDKEGIFLIWDRLTELVQETYICDQFKQRAPGTGYRG